MSVICISSIRNIMFSYEFQFLEFSADCESAGISLSDSGGNVFFQGSYVPDETGTITLYDINEIVDSFIGNATKADIRLKCTDLASGLVYSYSTTVLRSSVAYNITASDFLSSHFLTSSDDIRYTSANRYEYLNLFTTIHEAVTADVIGLDSGGDILRQSYTIVPVGSYLPNDVLGVDVSPAQFLGDYSDFSQILEYTVRCGNRKQRYIVKPDETSDPAIAYRNRFNVSDTYYFSGTKESDPQIDRSQARINGQYLTYDVKEVMQFKAMTGIAVPGMEEYLHDIARSPEVRLLDSSGAMRDLLTVMDCDLKAVNDDNALNRFTVTYRHADKVSAKSFAPVTTRIFDNSFDKSYE